MMHTFQISGYYPKKPFEALEWNHPRYKKEIFPSLFMMVNCAKNPPERQFTMADLIFVCKSRDDIIRAHGDPTIVEKIDEICSMAMEIPLIPV